MRLIVCLCVGLAWDRDRVLHPRLQLAQKPSGREPEEEQTSFSTGGSQAALLKHYMEYGTVFYM